MNRARGGGGGEMRAGITRKRRLGLFAFHARMTMNNYKKCVEGKIE